MDSVHPTEWVLPNRIYFNKWIYQEFHPSKYVKHTDGRGFNPDPSQKIIRDYLHYDSPYRGVLAYHGLGSGKSCTSILTTESFIQHKSKIIVLTPASLENNYRKELKKCSVTGGLLRKRWTKITVTLPQEIDVLTKMYSITKTFVEKQKNILWVPTVPREFPPERVLSPPTYIRAMSEEDKNKVQEIFDYIIDQKYIFLHYNGLKNKNLDVLERKNDFGKDIFDDNLIVIDEVHSFISRVVNGGKIARRLYNLLIEKTNIKLILLSGTPVINHPFELCYTLNLLRGPLVEYSVSMLKGNELPSMVELENALEQEKLLPFIDDIRLDSGSNQIKLTLLPSGFIKKAKHAVEVVRGPKIYDPKEWVTRAINKLKKHIKVSAKLSVKDLNALPDKREDFMNLFFNTSDPDNPNVQKDLLDVFMKRITGIVSYYRISDESLFPRQLPMKYEKVEMSPRQFTYYVDKRTEEIAREEAQKLRARRQENDLFKTNSSYRAFSRMACNYVFPENIKRPFPSDIARVLKRELDLHEEDDIDMEDAPTVGKVDIVKQYEKDIQRALQKLEEEGSTYLEGPGLYESSPKMAKLMEYLENEPTKALMYSQFRSVEGLRIFRMVLDQAGWREIDFKQKSGGDWEIVDAEEVLKPEYDGKRYLVFGDKQKTDIIISLFNADLRFLPPTVQTQLQQAELTENLRGKLAALLMITQSGAEGLNLRNVRKVYILEPFWNEVRINQVIGRAIRKGSHLELPADERNVQVVMFLSTFSKKQKKANKTIEFKDGSLTTDESIRELALKKETIIQQFLRLIQANSMDCIFNAKDNKPLELGYTCFSYPINKDAKDISFLPDLNEDKKAFGFGQKLKPKKIKGRAVMKDGIKYVMLEDDKTLYDYQAYKDAGVLVEAI